MSRLEAGVWLVQAMVDVVLLWGLGVAGGKVEDLRWRMGRLEGWRKP
jgi:hypothetical protein